MNELDKLAMLLPHWMEHNNSHADTYGEWAERVSDHEELSKILHRLSEETRELNNILAEAQKMIGQK